MNYHIMFIALFFGILETAYFGWNMYPQSDAELVADGFTCLLSALAFVVRR